MSSRAVIPVLVTPFDSDESIDENSLRNEIDFCIANGATALCAPAFASESYKLSDGERLRVAEIVIQHCRRRVPVWVGTGFPSVRTTVEFSAHAESLGADGVMVVAPRAVPLGTAELTTFFEAVCQSIRIPVMVQDADSQGGGLPASFFGELARRCPNLRQAKLENVLPGERCQNIIRHSGGRIGVLYGWGGLRLFDGLAHGAHGVMPGPALVNVYSEIFRLCDRGQVDEGRVWFSRILPLLVFALDHLEVFIQMEKRMLIKLGIISLDHMREPTLHLGESYREMLEELAGRAIALIQEVRSTAG